MGCGCVFGVLLALALLWFSPEIYTYIRTVVVPQSDTSAESTEQTTAEPKPDHKAPRSLFDLSMARQIQRKEFLDRIIRDGRLKQFDFNGAVPKVWVSSDFRTLDYKTQETILFAVYGYSCGLSKTFGSDTFSFVAIRSADTDKTIGSYSPSAGLVFLD